MERDHSPVCGRCGAALGGSALEGLCAACLLESAFVGQDVAVTGPVSIAPLASFGDYELLEEIARGGMGVVYLARQISLDRLVALKMILGGHLANAAEMQRFRAEAQTAAQLQHPNIVAIHEVGEHAGQPFFSMDLVKGRNLAQLVREGPLPSRQAATYLKTIAEAVHYAHSQGVLHRDLKPSNILIDENDEPRVTDFGLAKRLNDSQPSAQDPQLTQTGQLLGSPSYIPPEQAAGRKDGIGPASDGYSLGAILYHCLTGRPPFLAETLAQTLRMVAEQEPVSTRLLNAGVPRDLETICLKCLQKDPARRYATAGALADDLNRFLNNEPIRARPVNLLLKVHRWCVRNKPLAIAGTAILALLVVVAVESTVAAVRLKHLNRESREKLRDSLLAQANANRWSGRPGRRFASLEALGKAAEIRPGVDLRNEAIAAMSLVDVRSVKQWSVDHAQKSYLHFDYSFERYLRTHTNGSVTVHRVKDDQELFAWAAGGSADAGFDFLPESGLLVAGLRSDGFAALKVYDPNQRTNLLEVTRSWIRKIGLSPDRRKLVVAWTPADNRSGAMDRSVITTYRTADWQEIITFEVRFLPYWCAFDSTGDRLAISSTGSRDLEIRSADTGKLIQLLKHSSGVRSLAWASDGKVIASTADDQSIYLWDLSKSPPQETRVANDAVVATVCFNPQGDLLITGDWTDSVKIWDVVTCKELLRWPASAVDRTDGRWISCYATWKRAELFEISAAPECRTLRFKPLHGGTSRIAYSPDGQLLVSTHADGVRVWDANSCREITFVPIGPAEQVQFSRTGRQLVVPSGQRVFRWAVDRLQKGETNAVAALPAQPSLHVPPAIDPQNRMVTVLNNQAWITDEGSGLTERQITPGRGAYSAALSPDGRLCATWGLGSIVVEVCTVEDGVRRAELAAAPSPCLFFSPDGRWLVTGSSEEYVFWELSSWKAAHSISRGATGGTHGRVAFNSDGTMVGLSIGRGAVELFDTSTMTSLATFGPQEGSPVSWIAFSPDGTQLAISFQSPQIQLWNLPLVRQQLNALKLNWPSPQGKSSAP